MSTAASVTETPLKHTAQGAVSLPPLSSILLSPAESSLRNSLIHESTPQRHKVPLLPARAKPNIFNTGGAKPPHSSRAFSLPSIESLTASPTLKKSLSCSASLPLPTPYHDSFYNKSFVPATPLTHKLPLAPILNQSTPLHLSRSRTNTSIFPVLSKQRNANVSLTSDNNESSFCASTPFKSTLNTSSLSSGSENIFSSKNIINSSTLKSDLSIKLQAKTPGSVSKKRKASLDESKSFAFISHSQETFLSNEPNIDNARLARRKRRRTSPTELAILKEEFKKGTTPNKQRRILIAKRVDMTEKAVQIWFQNKRQAMRKIQNQNSKEFVVEINSKKSPDTSDDEDMNEDEDAENDNDNDNDNDNNNDNDNGNDNDNDEHENEALLSVSNKLETYTEAELKIASESGIYSDDSSLDSKQLNLLEENKENIDPDVKSPSKVGSVMSLPPKGIFSSPLSSTKSGKKMVLTDITNQQAGQTFKFKSTNFGLISHNAITSRRQKPTMKLKLKSGFANSSKPNEFKHQGLVILKDATNHSNTKSEIKLKVHAAPQLKSEN